MRRSRRPSTGCTREDFKYRGYAGSIRRSTVGLRVPVACKPYYARTTSLWEHTVVGCPQAYRFQFLGTYHPIDPSWFSSIPRFPHTRRRSTFNGYIVNGTSQGGLPHSLPHYRLAYFGLRHQANTSFWRFTTLSGS